MRAVRAFEGAPVGSVTLENLLTGTAKSFRELTEAKGEERPPTKGKFVDN